VARAVQELPPVTRIVVHAPVLFIFMFLSSAWPPAPAFAQLRDTEPWAQEATPVSPERPVNIRVDDVLQPLVSALLAKSETLRRQWKIITASRLIRVTVVSRMGMQDTASARARTEVSRYALGAIRATIEIPSGADVTELLPHEFEHVIEQLEGLDLRALAQQHVRGVVEVRKGVFETARARAAGLQVYREVYDRTDAAAAAAFAGGPPAYSAPRAVSLAKTGPTTVELRPHRRPGAGVTGPHLHKRW
jgi:hypothetical protein